MIEWVRQRLHWPEHSTARSLPLDHQQAGDIVSLCAGKLSDHQIMEQNVANYLAHMRSLGDELPAEALRDKRSLDRAVGAGMTGWSNQPDSLEKLRWRSKLDREIHSPYADFEVGQRLRECLSDLRSVLPEFSSLPHQLYLVGGPLGEREGRFGGNSDLDVVMKIDSENLARARALIRSLEKSERKHTFELHVTTGQQFSVVTDYYGSAVLLDEQRLDSQVETVVREGLSRHGLQVDEHWRAHRTEWNEPTTLSASTRFPREAVTSLKA
ncbi:hypothetical protein JST97_14690 [bacterium]|nr:hypothetical protein [bacterium]